MYQSWVKKDPNAFIDVDPRSRMETRVRGDILSFLHPAAHTRHGFFGTGEGGTRNNPAHAAPPRRAGGRTTRPGRCPSFGRRSPARCGCSVSETPDPPRYTDAAPTGVRRVVPSAPFRPAAERFGPARAVLPFRGAVAEVGHPRVRPKAIAWRTSPAGGCPGQLALNTKAAPALPWTESPARKRSLQTPAAM